MHIKNSILTLSVLFFIGLLSACSKNNNNTPGKTTSIIEVTLQSSDQSSTSGASLELLTYPDTAKIKGTTNAGKVDFTVTPGKTYYLYNIPSDLKLITDPNAAYIVIGTFTSQDQINTSPFQGPNTKVGDNIDLDINGDGAITDEDKVVKIIAPAAGVKSSVSLTISAQQGPQ